MKKLLVVVDIQNDFVDGALGSKEAVAIIPNAVNKIKNWDGEIVCTADTHPDNYLETNEGKHLPVPHCIEETDGWMLNKEIANALGENPTIIPKPTFGSLYLAEYIREHNFDRIEFIGLCTDICVVSNVLLAKAYLPEASIAVDASCCAGVTPESHDAAIQTMKMCQIEIVGE